LIRQTLCRYTDQVAESPTRRLQAEVVEVVASASRPILVVDDNSEVLEVLRLLLEGEGYAVETAANGAEALEQLRAGLKPSLIILDLTMPVMDGWQFRAEQLADEELSKIPTIIYSAVGSLDAARSITSDGTIHKGADFAEMLRLVADLCRRA